jgi:[ribosomal protein S5]-alanine N-acetyltransferase
MRKSAREFRTYIKAPCPDDAGAFLAAMRRSEALHHPWVTAPRDSSGWRRYLERLERDSEAGFLVRLKIDNAICGVVNLNVITFDALCSAYISYYGVAGYVDQGYMKEGLSQVVRHAFDKLGLHRLEANIQPDNAASIALARAVGFRYEGYSPRYLMINGEWRDHERWAILADEGD